MTQYEIEKMLIDNDIPISDEMLSYWTEQGRFVLDNWQKFWSSEPSWHWSKSVIRLVGEVNRLRSENTRLREAVARANRLT